MRMDFIYTNTSVEQVKESESVEVSEVTGGASALNAKVKNNDEDIGSISFHNITYAVEQRMCFKKRPPKIILNDVRYGITYITIRNMIRS